MLACLPAWHSQFVPVAPARVPSGCAVDCNRESATFGLIPCAPESMRARSEKWLLERNLWRGPLPLSVYSLGRNIATETGSGSIETKMALALSTMGQAARGVRGRDVHSVIIRNASGYQFYGPIHPEKSCRVPGATSANIHKRWTASSLDPTVLDLAIAAFALSGAAGAAGDVSNFAMGADDQADWSAIDPHVQAREGDYWVGPIPGVNHKKLVLMKKMGLSPASPEGQMRIAALAAMLRSPEPDWGALPLCPVPPPVVSLATKRIVGATIGLGAVGIVVGLAVYMANRYA